MRLRETATGLLLVVSALAVTATPGFAQAAKPGWQFELTPYL